MRGSGRYDPQQVTDAVVLRIIKKKADELRFVVSGGRLFDESCSRLRQLLDAFVDAKGEWLTED
jgi:hypothetical protein